MVLTLRMESLIKYPFLHSLFFSLFCSLLNVDCYQVWDLVFRNTGVRHISNLIIAITPAANSAVNQNNKWNLVYNAATETYPP